MEKKKLGSIFYRLVFVVFLTITPFSATYAQDAQDDLEGQAERFEIMFMENMSDHHLAAVEMGNLCVQKATRNELKETCRQIVANQTNEIKEMQSLLRTWYGISYEPRLRDDNERMIEELRRLSGQSFDIEFMKGTTNHHRQAILMSADALVVAFHRELLDLANNIAVTQADEARQFRAWLNDWYRIRVIMPEIGPRG